MSDKFRPWTEYPSLTQRRLSDIAELIRISRHEAVLLHDPTAGDNEWSLGCRVYARTCNSLRSAAKDRKWLTILHEDEKPLRFTFAIGSIPIKFYRGGAGDPPSHYLNVPAAELQQQQLAFKIDGISLVDHLLRLAVATDASREVSSVVLVKIDMAGNVFDTYRIAFPDEHENVGPLRPKPVDLGPPPLEPRHEEAEAKKHKDRNASSQ